MDESLELEEAKQDQEKYFDVFSRVDVKEAVGTFFLGLISLLLFLALRQTQQRYEELLKQIALGD